jgi:Amt family ammonium transporter
MASTLKKFSVLLITLATLFFTLPAFAFAKSAAKVDTGDTAWILISIALVMLMTPGLALFYGGMVRKKNALSTLMLSFIALAVISIQWILIGYSLAFAPSTSGLIGSLKWLGLNGVTQIPNADYAATIPHLAFMAFQLMFAIITPALISGALVDRVKFSSFMVFILLWATFVYDPVAHWVWGINGWLRNLGALDFAGGTVVHITAGISALAFAIILGKRKGYGNDNMEPHNIPMTVLGAALLWFGWFGFNAGSALGSNGLASLALVNTNTSAAAAALTWMVISWASRKPSALGLATGAVAGLVAITPAAGFVTPLSSILIGAGASVLCYLVVGLRMKYRIDESLDVFGCHGVGGIWGAIATGIFATKAVNPAGSNGLLYGNPGQLLTQAIAVVSVAVFAFIITVVLVKVIDMVLGLRVTDTEEVVGLDISQHGEIAYS